MSSQDIFGSADLLRKARLFGEGPSGSLSLTDEQLRESPSGDLFGLTQNVGMGASPEDAHRPQFLIVSTQGGLPGKEGEPLALGYHTGHWELIQLVEAAARAFRQGGALPFAAFCSDPCDGRSQGTSGMMDSLPYRNDAAVVVRRLIRSLPQRRGVMAVATCDKGLPAMLLALAGTRHLPGIVVPGGVTLPAIGAEDAGTVQTLGARYSHDMVSLEYAAEMSCRACGSSGGGCQFLGTAASAQVIAEGMGLTLPHAALAPSGEEIWLDLARRSAIALMRLEKDDRHLAQILDQRAMENAMLLHAAFGGSTNILLHLPAVAHAAGLRVPEVADWDRVNRSTPRLVDALPNGPRNHPTVQVFMAGGVPEVMLHLRNLGLLHRDVETVVGLTWDEILDGWEESPQRRAARERLRSTVGVDPDDVIMSPESARARGLTGTVVFPRGNLVPEGAVVKATAIDPSVCDENQIYRHEGPARVCTSESQAIRWIKERKIQEGDVLILIGIGPLGTGMEEIYQITSALKFVPWGKSVPVLTDGRFSGVSTGACIGHIGPEALAGGPIGRVRDGDRIEIVIDRNQLRGHIEFLGPARNDKTSASPLSPEAAAELLRSRSPHPDLKPHRDLPADTRLWAALQQASGGIWQGAVYDLDKILAALRSSGP